jgi:hypothetical protein
VPHRPRRERQALAFVHSRRSQDRERRPPESSGDTGDSMRCAPPNSFSDLLIPVLFRHQHGACRVHAGVAWTCCLFFGETGVTIEAVGDGAKARAAPTALSRPAGFARSAAMRRLSPISTGTTRHFPLRANCLTLTGRAGTVGRTAPGARDRDNAGAPT